MSCDQLLHLLSDKFANVAYISNSVPTLQQQHLPRSHIIATTTKMIIAKATILSSSHYRPAMFYFLWTSKVYKSKRIMQCSSITISSVKKLHSLLIQSLWYTTFTPTHVSIYRLEKWKLQASSLLYISSRRLIRLVLRSRLLLLLPPPLLLLLLLLYCRIEIVTLPPTLWKNWQSIIQEEEEDYYPTINNNNST